MKRFDYRILVGAALILGGVLMLLDQTGILKGAADLFWAGLLAIGAAIFLIWFFTDQSRWWAAIPGFTLAGLSVSSLLLNRIGWGGLALLGGIGLGFWAVYFSGRQRWWAIIPGGVLVTLGITSVMSNVYGVMDSGGVFFVGLGLTFVLVAILAKMKWAFIPAAVLLLLGFFLGTPFVGIMEYIWIGILLVAGIILIVSAVRE
ncbi:MAG TPA: hypothetical protein VMT91_09635 [Anaerolineales bacterium]|nr:hypothetical protein [Anaerolineales bacterium]